MPDVSDHLTLATAPAAICSQLGVPGCILLTANLDGSIGYSGHGLNHLKANELLSVGIHINLSQHDQMVATGAAGDEARDLALSIRDEGGVA